ncbi:HNH endonuclease [Rhodobacteraceae bacterium]|nr:HNH endonuclease [Paracoccaceae bacterium]
MIHDLGAGQPDSKCDFYICDKRYSQLGNFLPARFTKSWKEGAKKEVTLSKAERSTEIRREAFKHYEKKCYCCEKKPKFDSMLQIHHLDPIAEGERQTEIEDVIPLCATCHIAAHTENPPIPIDRLREMELWEA